MHCFVSHFVQQRCMSHLLFLHRMRNSSGYILQVATMGRTSAPYTHVLSATTEDAAVAVPQEELEAERIQRLNDLKEDAIAPCSRVSRKRKPRPGHYPEFFSPFRLTMGPASAIPVSRTDVKEDLMAIKAGYAVEFASTYFDEEGTPGSVAGQSEISIPAAVSVSVASNSRASKARRRSITMDVPCSRADEERQLRAALKASQLATSLFKAPVPVREHSFFKSHASEVLSAKLSNQGRFRHVRGIPSCGVA